MSGGREWGGFALRDEGGELSLEELARKPPSIREKITKGTIWIYFPKGMKPNELKFRPMNPYYEYNKANARA